MSRRTLALLVLSLAAVVAIAACQDYNLNPVGSCLIQPGSRQVKLDSISTADILFVVDDSQSMTPKQNALASNFSRFIDALAGFQAQRKSQGLEPFDFYIAVTTSAIFDYSSSSQAPRTTYVDPATTNPRCNLGVGATGAPYPAGTFVSAPDVPDKVLKFTKDLDWAHHATDAQIQGLIGKFQKNIMVGSCGSNQEQHLEAARLAIQKVQAGTQPIAAGDFLHEKAKLVVVWVGDEDDCSNPYTNAEHTKAAVLRNDCNTNPPNADTYALSEYQNFFNGLGRPFGAAEILSADCSNGTCTPAVCACAPALCDGQGEPKGWAAGYRLHALTNLFRSNGNKVVEGSVCQDFGPLLVDIANLVQPPSTLALASPPASSEITVVRIIDTNGNQRRICTQAKSSGETGSAGWWFTTDSTPLAASPSCDDSGSFAGVAPTRCVYINHASTTHDCEAGAGETYSAEYLGTVPPGGCTSASDCALALSGDVSKAALYECYSHPPETPKGTCLCK